MISVVETWVHWYKSGFGLSYWLDPWPSLSFPNICLSFPLDSCVASSSASPPVSAARLPPVSSSTNYASSSSSLRCDQSSGLSLSRFLISVPTIINAFTIHLTVVIWCSLDCDIFRLFFSFLTHIRGSARREGCPFSLQLWKTAWRFSGRTSMSVCSAQMHPPSHWKPHSAL